MFWVRSVNYTFDWQGFMRKCSKGDHFAVWGSLRGLAPRILNQYLTDGLLRDELVLVVMPRNDLDVIKSFAWKGMDIQTLMTSGYVRVAASEDIMGSSTNLPGEIRKLLLSLIQEVKASGKTGLRILGRIAPLLFERGEDKIALMIEELVHSLKGNYTLLCLYESSSLDDLSRFAVAAKLCEAHTHSMFELSNGNVLVETQNPILVRK